MSVVTKFWIFVWVSGFTFIFLGAVLRNSESAWVVFLAFVVVTGVGQYFFRCPRCRWPINIHTEGSPNDVATSR